MTVWSIAQLERTTAEDAVTIAHYRATLNDGEYSDESAEVQAACASLHTPEKIAAYQAKQEAAV